MFSKLTLKRDMSDAQVILSVKPQIIKNMDIDKT